MKRNLSIIFALMLLALTIVGCSSNKEETQSKEQPKTKIRNKP